MKTFLYLLLFCLTFSQASFAQLFGYVVNFGDDDVSIINTDTNMTFGPPIAVGGNPNEIAITPDGTRAYVTNSGPDNVSVINTASNMVVDPPIAVGLNPNGIAITPDGTRAYVVNTGSNNVSVIDTATNMVVVSAIMVGDGPINIAITPDGTRAYVTNFNVGTVSVIDTTTNMVVGSPIMVGADPDGIAITPDGTRAYVVNAGPNDVSVINTATNMVIAPPIAVGTNPSSIAITPDGMRAYVTNSASANVSVIDTTTNMVVGSPISVGIFPTDVAITPDGTRAYVTVLNSDNVSVIDTATNMVSGSPIMVGDSPVAIAFALVENQPSPDISLSPDSAENSILTQQTVSALVEVDGSPQQGVLVEFEVRSGPNRGESSSPGECFPNADCTTDTNGQVSWTYTGGPNPGTDTVRASFFNQAEQREELSNAALVTWTSPISLSPTSATNEVRTEHTVTALLQFNGSPESGILVDFEIIAGPNLGEPGECSPNADCTTDGNGEVSWTYTSGGRLGTDTIVASFFDQEFQATVDSNQAFKTWVLPERAIPTMSEWGMMATAAVLGIASLLFLRRRKASIEEK